METGARALWLILISLLLFLVSSLIEPPQSAVLFILRVVVPLALVVCMIFMLVRWKKLKRENQRI